MHRFISEPLIAHMAADTSFVRRWTKQIIILLAFSFLIVAAANPQIGTRLEEVQRKGIDIFVALDVSLSMKAEDIRPSRLEKAKRDVSNLLKKLQGDRVGLIVFAGEAYVQFPLTADYSAADLFLSAVDVDVVPTPGTMIGRAMERALESFRTDLPTQKAIIVVSDGENTQGDLEGPLEKAKSSGVRVYTIGMGTVEGGPIPIYNSSGVRVDYKKDQTGSIVLTRLDESALQQIALSTGGSYRRATSGGNEIDDIFKELSSLEQTDLGTLQVAGYEDQFQYPLTIGLLLLLIEMLISERKGRFLLKLKRLLPMGRVTAIVVMIFAASETHAQTVRAHVKEGNAAYEKGQFADAEVGYKKGLEKDPLSREARFNLGDAYYRQQRFQEAQREFNASTAQANVPTDQAASWYNLGNALFKENKLPESIEAYKQSLRLNPADDDARYNLLLAKERLKNEQQQNQQNKQDQQNQNQQQEQQKRKQARQDQVKQHESHARQQKNQMPKDEAARILEALRNNERKIQKQLRKHEGPKIRVEKDW